MKIKKYLLWSAVALTAFASSVGIISFGVFLRTTLETKVRPQPAAAAPSIQSLFAVEPPAGQDMPIWPAESPPAAETADIEAESTECESEGFDFFGEYYPVDVLPKAFTDVDGIVVITRDYEVEYDDDSYGSMIPPKGYLDAGREFNFARVALGNKEIAFETERLSGISYQFVGRQIDDPRYDEELEATIGITGRLIKLRNGKKIAETQIRLAISETCGC